MTPWYIDKESIQELSTSPEYVNILLLCQNSQWALLDTRWIETKKDYA